ncbi:hypothetical protein RHSIM_Rhsim03G0005800 [Rhododendron simsii]|uniref:J domain-containing protein n=1 Tax=Rhododendron simsii TaxID=118357 RepID=A0A834LTR4_RHOSS|nr:hypothetical protein RHSIM_Rhsim03G0005800 [Rhododendron simsii]
MNRATRPALLNSQANPFNLRAISLFHSTPVLDRKRRTHWDSRFDTYSKRFRKLQSKQTLLRNVGAFSEHLFQGRCYHTNIDDRAGGMVSKNLIHFQVKTAHGLDVNLGLRIPKGALPAPKDPIQLVESGFRNPMDVPELAYSNQDIIWDSSSDPYCDAVLCCSFHFCDDDNDFETIFFRSAFGGNRFGGNQSFYWSFIEEDFPNRWQSSSGHQNNYRTSWNWRHREDEDYDSSTEFDSSETDLVSYRLVLGLSPSGPLKLDDVKNAYRTCALKWHPDRHQGSSKAVAEEKFKACSAAYESLCDKMALN